MKRLPIILALACLSLAGDAATPPPGSLAIRGVGSASQALNSGLWGAPNTATFIPPHAQILIYRRKFVDGRVTDEFEAAVYLGSVSFIQCEQNGTVPGSAAKWPVLGIYLDQVQQWNPVPAPPPPYAPAPNPGLVPVPVVAPSNPGMGPGDGQP